MNVSKSKKVIHGAKIEGAVFYGQDSGVKEENGEAEQTSEPPSVKTLQKLLKMAEKKGHSQGLKEGHEQGYEAGKSEGLEIGYKEGVANVRDELKSAAELLNVTASTFQMRKEEMFELVKPELIKFSLAVCEKILRAHLTNPEIFYSLLEKLLTQAKSFLKDVPIDIVLSQEDLQMVQNHLSALGYKREDLKDVNFISTPWMERGSCRLETTLGLVNFDLNRLLSDLEILTLSS